MIVMETVSQATRATSIRMGRMVRRLSTLPPMDRTPLMCPLNQVHVSIAVAGTFHVFAVSGNMEVVILAVRLVKSSF